MKYLPVSMSCSQAVGVHVSLWSSGNPITIHGTHHWVGPSLQQQTHQLKVTCTYKNMVKVKTRNCNAQIPSLCLHLSLFTSLWNEQPSDTRAHAFVRCWQMTCCYQPDSQSGQKNPAVCLYLQQQPAEVASLCSSPSRPAGNPPRWLWHPAATAGGSPDGRDGREQEEPGQFTSKAQLKSHLIMIYREQISKYLIFNTAWNYCWIYWVKKTWLSSLASIISIVWKLRLIIQLLKYRLHFCIRLAGKY